MTLMAVIAMTFKTLNQRVFSLSIRSLTLERKKKSKDPAAFATAMSAILSSSLKAHSRAVLNLIFWFSDPRIQSLFVQNLTPNPLKLPKPITEFEKQYLLNGKHFGR
jgi:hypothetical protein